MLLQRLTLRILLANCVFCAAILVTHLSPSCHVVIVAGSITGFGDAVAVVAERDCGRRIGSSVLSAKDRGCDSKAVWYGGGVPVSTALNGKPAGCVGVDKRARFDRIVCRSGVSILMSLSASLHAMQTSFEPHNSEASNMCNTGQTDLLA